MATNTAPIIWFHRFFAILVQDFGCKKKFIITIFYLYQVAFEKIILETKITVYSIKTLQN